MQPGDRGRGVGAVVETSIPLELPDTRERRCPSCASERIAPVSHVTASFGLIKVEHRCEACATAFWLVGDAIA